MDETRRDDKTRYEHYTAFAVLYKVGGLASAKVFSSPDENHDFDPNLRAIATDIETVKVHPVVVLRACSTNPVTSMNKLLHNVGQTVQYERCLSARFFCVKGSFGQADLDIPLRAANSADCKRHLDLTLFGAEPYSAARHGEKRPQDTHMKDCLTGLADAINGRARYRVPKAFFLDCHDRDGLPHMLFIPSWTNAVCVHREGAVNMTVRRQSGAYVIHTPNDETYEVPFPILERLTVEGWAAGSDNPALPCHIVSVGKSGAIKSKPAPPAREPQHKLFTNRQLGPRQSKRVAPRPVPEKRASSLG